MRKAVDRSAMIRLFEEIRDAFPELVMRLEHNPANVDINMDILQQPGCAFDVNLNLQGDELHLSAGAFWLEWFPCTRPDVVQAYREAVDGLLGGAYRIRERYRGGRPIKAELQKPHGTGWQTIGTWYGWAWPIPRRTVEKILHNVAKE
jgi:hypothetical protein